MFFIAEKPMLIAANSEKAGSSKSAGEGKTGSSKPADKGDAGLDKPADREEAGSDESAAEQGATRISDWRAPIVSYLKNPSQKTDRAVR